MLPIRFRRTLMAALVAPALAVPALVLAENNQRQQSQQQQQQQQSQSSAAGSHVELQRDDMRVSQITGMKVKNPQGEDLGEVKDVVIDARSGKVQYVALSHGGFLGIGEDLFAYPVSAFTRGEDRNELILRASVTEDDLKRAEGFNDDNWPKVRNDESYWSRISRRFDSDRSAEAPTGASAGASQERSFVRASKLTDKDLQDRSGNNLGEVEDLVINLSDGSVRFAVIDTAGDDRLVAVPMDALSVRDDGDEPALRFEQERLDLSRAFDKDEWPEQLRGRRNSGS